jgi:hypothetical protein
MWRLARDDKVHPEVSQREDVIREPLPSGRAILWKPLPDSYHLLASMMRAPEQQASLFITQRAFLQVERHLRSGPDLELGGFLAGQLYECPRTQVRYAVVNTVVPFADVSEDPIGSRVTQEGFDTVQKRLVRHQLSMIGWYRNGNGLGLQLLPDDIETHTTYFEEPWQTTMIVVQTATKSAGAFFTYDSCVGRSYCIPFYELFDTRAAEAKRLDRTCVSWATYVAAAPVQPLAEPEKEIVETTVAMRPAPSEPEPLEPIDEWWDAIKDPWVKLKDVAAKTPRRDDQALLRTQEPAGRQSYAAPRQVEAKVSPPPVPPAASQPIAAPPTPAAPKVIAVPPQPAAPKRIEAPPPAAPSKPIEAPPPPAHATQRTKAPRPEPTRAAPPFVGPTRAAAGPSAPVHAEPATRTAERQAPREAAVAPIPAPRSQPQPRRAPLPPRPIPPATVEAMQRSAAAPAVALPPDFYNEAMKWQRRRRIGFAVAAASFLAVIILSTIRARTSGSAQPPPASLAEAPPPATQLTPSLNGDVILALPVAVDSLSGALSYYREIEADHRGGLVGCRVLGRAYRLVGHARTRVDSARDRVTGPLDAADSIRVAMLRAEYTHVAQTYQRSGCAR